MPFFSSQVIAQKQLNKFNLSSSLSLLHSFDLVQTVELQRDLIFLQSLLVS